MVRVIPAANKLMCGDTVLPVAHHRSEAALVKEVCWKTDHKSPKPAINSHVHHKQLSLHKQPRNQELAL